MTSTSKSGNTVCCENIPFTTNRNDINLSLLTKSPKVIDFFKNMNEIGHFVPMSFHVTDADWFCKPGAETHLNLGFWKGKLEALNAVTGKKVISNICNNRGGCVACLFIVTCYMDGKTETLIPLTVQDRLPSGRECEELIAGMKDEETGRLKLGKLAKEIQEEMPICEISEDDPDIISLGYIFPSPGWSDEYIELWCKEIEIDYGTYCHLKTGTFGEGDHECIKVKFYDYNEDFKTFVVPNIKDCKLLSALYKYEALKKSKSNTFLLAELLYKITVLIAIVLFIYSLHDAIQGIKKIVVFI